MLHVFSQYVARVFAVDYKTIGFRLIYAISTDPNKIRHNHSISLKIWVDVEYQPMMVPKKFGNASFKESQENL